MTQRTTGSLHDEYLAALLATDATRARHVVTAAVDAGTPVEEIYLRVLEPALAEVGELWERHELSVAYEHYATAITQGVMGALAPRMRVAPTSGRLAVLACSPGERHCLGPAMVADFLEAAGWEVLQLGSSLPAAELAALVEDEQPDVVGLSTATADRLIGAEAALDALRAARVEPHVVVGGRAWRDVPEAEALAMGADARLLDPRELVRHLAERLPALEEREPD